MKVVHAIKFNLGQQFEMHSVSLEVDDSELGLPTTATPDERMQAMQKFLVRQGIVFRAYSGYITIEEAQKMLSGFKYKLVPEV